MAKVWYLGHSCLRFELDGKSIITDPFIRPNPLAEDIDYDALQADYILVSHGHHDHVADLLDLAESTQATVIANFELTSWVEKHGYANVFGMNIGGTAGFGSLGFKMTNAVHSSSFADGSYAGNPGGFVVTSSEKCIYFAGDTALTRDMTLIADEFNLDLAILPVGDVFTMNATDACTAAELVKCNKVMGIHYDTFPPIRIDHSAAQNIFKENGKELHLLPIGTALEF